MDFPKDQVELDIITSACERDGDERAAMLAQLAANAIDALDKARTAAGTMLEGVERLLDTAEVLRSAHLVTHAEVDSLREMIVGLRTGKPDAELTLTQVHNNGVTLGFKSHWAVRMNVYALKESLRKEDGTYWNNIEMKMTDAKLGELLVTLQRKPGKTPGDIIAELKAEVERLKRFFDVNTEVGIDGIQTAMEELTAARDRIAYLESERHPACVSFERDQKREALEAAKASSDPTAVEQ